MTKAPQLISISQLKDCLDAFDKLKIIRRELKNKLNKEGLSDEEEAKLAANLKSVSEKIEKLEKIKLHELSEPASVQ